MWYDMRLGRDCKQRISKLLIWYDVWLGRGCMRLRSRFICDMICDLVDTVSKEDVGC